MAPEQVRVVVAGHTGLNKLRCIQERIVPLLLALNPKWVEANDRNDDAECARIHAEEILILELEEKVTSTAYGMIGYPTGQSAWKSSFLNIKKQWLSKHDKPIKYVFLLAHLSFQNEGHFYTPLTWTSTDETGAVSFAFLNFLVSDFSPNFIVTLIDDIYNVQSRLNPKHHFRLSELLRWRNIESLLADYAMDAVEIENLVHKDAMFPYLNSPIFSIGQSAHSLVTYISSPHTPRIYLSYPISEPLKEWRFKNTRSLIDQINHFRVFFDANAVVFDPITINERPIYIALNDAQVRETALDDKRVQDFSQLIMKLRKAHSESDSDAVMALTDEIEATGKAWSFHRKVSEPELELGPLWPSADIVRISPVPISPPAPIKRSEIQEIITANHAKSEIDRQIKIRDFRLIDQSDCIVIYRPCMSKQDWSTGTSGECNYARNSGKAVIVLSARGDPVPEGPFDHILPSEDVVTIDDPESQNSRDSAFNVVLDRVKHYSGELLRKGLR